MPATDHPEPSISDAAWARIIAHLQKRRFRLHIPRDREPWLEQMRR